jgi:hypothetical protein
MKPEMVSRRARAARPPDGRILMNVAIGGFAAFPGFGLARRSAPAGARR